MRSRLSVGIAALVILIIAPGVASAWEKASSISYASSSGSSTLSGYSQTWPDAWDWFQDWQCSYYQDDGYGYYCYLYFGQVNYPSVDAEAYTPASSLYYQSGHVISEGTATGSYSLENIGPDGTWTGVGHHGVDQYLYWMYCPFSFCFGPTSAGHNFYTLGDTSVQQSVLCDPGAAYPALSAAFIPRAAADLGIASTGPLFSATFTVYVQNATSTENSEFFQGANAWNFTGYNCGTFYTSVDYVQAATSSYDVDVIYVTSIPGSDPADVVCGGAATRVGTARDVIDLLRTGINSYCDNHRVETVTHELGHLFGFKHIYAPNPPDLYFDPRPASSPTRSVHTHHVRILTEKY